MNRRSRIISIILVLGTWTIPVWRAVSFWGYALAVYHEESSLNALNDLKYSVALIGAYSFSIATPAALLFMLRMPRIAVFALLGGCVLVAGDVIRRHPEEVIVLFPSMNPWRPVCWTVILVAVVGCACAWQYLGRLESGTSMSVPISKRGKGRCFS